MSSPPTRTATRPARWSSPDPTDYAVIVPLGARWAAYDEALRDSWLGAEMDMVRRAVDAGVGVLGVCSSQAFTLGTALALQFHPELDSALLETWLTNDRDGSAAGMGRTHDELRLQTQELADDVAVRVRALVRGFLNRVVRTKPST